MNRAQTFRFQLSVLSLPTVSGKSWENRKPHVKDFREYLYKMEHIDGNRTIVSRLPSANSAIELNVRFSIS